MNNSDPNGPGSGGSLTLAPIITEGGLTMVNFTITGDARRVGYSSVTYKCAAVGE